MNKIIEKAASALIAAVLAAGTFSSVPVSAGAEEEAAPKITTISFNYDFEGVYIPEDENGEPQTIESISGEVGSSEFLPKVQLEKNGYKFQGWTFDGIQGFFPGDVVQFKDEDVVMTPVFYCKDYEESHPCVYKVEYDGIVIEKPDKPATYYAPEGKMITLSLLSLQREGYKHLGWIVDGETYLRGGQKLVMPNRDVEIEPKWLKVRALTYTAGDFDRIVGATDIFFEQPETTSTELQAADRFSRDGFYIAGWLSSYDNKVYQPEETFTMPEADVILTAVWEPTEYRITFNPGTGSADTFRVRGCTDTSITIPECTAVKAGYTFAGWKYDGKTYQPGDEFFIGGLSRGLGYAFSAVWTKDGSGSSTTTTTTTTTTLVTGSEITGDANCDGKVNIADAAFIMQCIGNPDKYQFTEQGEKNADVNKSGDVTTLDALAIQQYKLSIISDLSEAVTAPEE